MKLAFHWRVALWNAVLIGLALALFGVHWTTFLFSAVAIVLTLAISWRLRNQLTLPIARLTASLRNAQDGRTVTPVIPRGIREVRELVSAVAEWRTEMHTNLSELSEAHVRLESVLRAMDEGVLVFDRTGRVMMSNEAFLRLLDLPRTPQGRTAIELFRNEALDRAIQAALRGDTVETVEFQAGPNRILRALVSPVISGSATRAEAAVMVLEDLTDIRQVDRIRRDFVANVSHEFKTPLTSIRGYAETMLAELSEPGQREFADTIRRNARYLESLVNDLLTLARIESEPPFVLEDVDLQALINAQVRLRRKPDSELAPEISVECPSLRVRVDSSRLGIALSNLIDNAIRYNRPSGVTSIVCRRDRDHIVIEVRDQGYGIPQGELPRIFERFYRVDKARTRNAGGTGLGLAIARHAVESQGGTLTVNSRVGVGSTFEIRLPFREARFEVGSLETSH